MRVLYYLCTFTILFFFSCNNENKEKKDYFSAQTKVINIPENLDIISHSDSTFSSISFLSLETKDECMISFIVNLKIVDSLIYINDGFKRLLVFDSKGKFKYQIGSKGNGPGEYLEMRDYIVCNDHIEILDFKKIQTYSLSGEYIKTKHFDFLDPNNHCNATFFTPSPLGGYYLWGGTTGKRNIGQKDKQYLMFHVNKDMIIEEEIFPVTHGSGSCFYRFSNYENLTIIDPSYGDYNIYQIDNKGKISPRYYFDFGNKSYTKQIPIPNKNNANKINEELNNYVVEMNNFLETNNWIHIDFAFKQYGYSAFYSKKKDKVYLLSAASKAVSSNEFRFWSALFAEEETLVMPIDASWMQIELNRITPESIKKMNLEEYKDKNEFDNPILVYYKLK